MQTHFNPERQKTERSAFIAAIQAAFQKPSHAEDLGGLMVKWIAEMQADCKHGDRIVKRIEDAVAVYRRDGKVPLTEKQQQHILAVVKVVLVCDGTFSDGYKREEN